MEEEGGEPNGRGGRRLERRKKKNKEEEKRREEEEKERGEERGRRKSWLGWAILKDNLVFGGNFNLRGGSVRGATRLPGIFFFLTFFYYSFI